MANNNPLQIDLNDTIGTFRQKVNSISSIIGDWTDIVVPVGEQDSDYLSIVTSINAINEKFTPEAIRNNISLVATNSAIASLTYNPVTGIFNFVSGGADSAAFSNLDAGIITTGVFAAARIPDLDASKITTGIIDSAVLPTLTATVSSTDAVPEGSSNLYFTTARARGSISAGTGISYNSGTGEISATGVSLNAGTGISIVGSTISIGQSVATNADVAFNSVVAPVEIVRLVSSAPSNRSDSAALTKGCLYYDSTTNKLYAYNGTSWVEPGPVSSVTAGDGISVNSTTGAITVTNDGVTGLASGTGISLNATTGVVSITNSGVTSLVAGTGISINASSGDVTVSMSGSSDYSRVVQARVDGNNSSSALPATGTWTIPNTTVAVTPYRGSTTQIFFPTFGGSGATTTLVAYRRANGTWVNSQTGTGVTESIDNVTDFIVNYYYGA